MDKYDDEDTYESDLPKKKKRLSGVMKGLRDPFDQSIPTSPYPEKKLKSKTLGSFNLAEAVASTKPLKIMSIKNAVESLAASSGPLSGSTSTSGSTPTKKRKSRPKSENKLLKSIEKSFSTFFERQNNHNKRLVKHLETSNKKFVDAFKSSNKTFQKSTATSNKKFLDAFKMSLKKSGTGNSSLNKSIESGITTVKKQFRNHTLLLRKIAKTFESTSNKLIRKIGTISSHIDKSLKKTPKTPSQIKSDALLKQLLINQSKQSQSAPLSSIESSLLERITNIVERTDRLRRRKRKSNFAKNTRGIYGFLTKRRRVPKARGVFNSVIGGAIAVPSAAAVSGFNMMFSGIKSFFGDDQKKQSKLLKSVITNTATTSTTVKQQSVVLSTIENSVKGIFKFLKTQIIDAVPGKPKSIFGAIGDVLGKLFTFGKSMVGGLVNDLLGSLTKLGLFFTGTVGPALIAGLTSLAGAFASFIAVAGVPLLIVAGITAIVAGLYEAHKRIQDIQKLQRENEEFIKRNESVRQSNEEKLKNMPRDTDENVARANAYSDINQISKIQNEIDLMKSQGTDTIKEYYPAGMGTATYARPNPKYLELEKQLEVLKVQAKTKSGPNYKSYALPTVRAPKSTASSVVEANMNWQKLVADLSKNRPTGSPVVMHNQTNNVVGGNDTVMAVPNARLPDPQLYRPSR